MQGNKILRILILLLIVLAINNTSIYGQIQNCGQAYTMCDVANLDGLGVFDVLVLPPVDTDTVPQPTSLCNSTGVTDNPVWYSFIAGATEISFTITPRNCTEVPNPNGPDFSGIQAIIWDDCDLSGVGDFGTALACVAENASGTNGVSTQPIVLTSDQFIIGHTYFLQLDGYAGSVCEYSIEVTKGLDEYHLPNVAGIEYDSDFCAPYPLCAGVGVPFNLEDFNFGSGTGIVESTPLYFEWKISPVTSRYPSGLNGTSNDTVIFVFDTPGNYAISCTVYTINSEGGFCDTSNTVNTTIDITDSSILDEDFGDVEICQGKFPVVIATEPTLANTDPNGDGVLGWQGGPIMAVGLTEIDVVTPCGCIYKQWVNIIQLDLAPRVDIDTFICTSIPGPYYYGGDEISDDVVKNVTLVAENGCDSLVKLSATLVKLEGDIIVGDCTDSLELSFLTSFQNPNSFENIVFRWEDNLGDEKLDLDSEQGVLRVVDAGIYHLYIEVTMGNSTCDFYIGNVDVDLSTIAVPKLEPLNWPSSFCPGVDQLAFELMNGMSGVGYSWTFPSDVTIVSGQGSSKVVSDWSSSAGGEVCVTMNTICGQASPLCSTINLENLPQLALDLEDSICMEEIAHLSYTGETNHSYNYVWDFGVANAMNVGNPNVGPFELSYTTGGMKNVNVYLTNGVCTTAKVMDSVFVQEKLDAPELSCSTDGDKVTISWDIDPLVDSYQAILLDGLPGMIIDGNTYVSQGGNAGDAVELVIYGETLDFCHETYRDTITCHFGGCPIADLSLSVESSIFCEGDDSKYSLDVTINGDQSGSGNWTGVGLVDDSLFIPSSIPSGIHFFTYNYTIDNCTYMDSVQIEVLTKKEIKITEVMASCKNPKGQIIIDNLGNTDLEFAINGSDFSKEEVYDLVGSYTIITMDIDLCESTYTGTITPFTTPTIVILGKESIKLGDDINLSYQIDIDNSRIDSVIWSKGNVQVCVDCAELTMTQESFLEEYCLTVYYDGGCSLTTCKLISAVDYTGIYFPNIIGLSSDNDFSKFIVDIGHREGILKKLTIYDHWGGEMYKMKNQTFTGTLDLWDGHFKGQPVQPGVYVYVYRLEIKGGESVESVGDLTVVR